MYGLKAKALLGFSTHLIGDEFLLPFFELKLFERLRVLFLAIVFSKARPTGGASMP